MEGLARVTGAPVTVSFLGRDVLLDPLRLRDFGALEQYLLKNRPNLIVQASQAARLITRQAKEEAAAISAKDPDRAAKVQALIEEAQSQADSVLNKAIGQSAKIGKISHEEMAQWLDTVEGMAYCFWLKLSQRYGIDAFSLDAVTAEFEKMTDEAFAEMLAARDQAAGTDLLGNSTGQTETTTANPNLAPSQPNAVPPTGAESSGS
jgi:hypothetical protein